jgi:hypothetical protein
LKVNSDEYRDRAQRYLILARRTVDPVRRPAIIDAAMWWMELAQQAEMKNRVAQQQQQIQPEKKLGT